MTATMETRPNRNGGIVIRAAREGMGLTQQQLAEQAGVSRSWLNRVENGHVDLYREAEQIHRCPECGHRAEATITAQWQRVLDVIVNALVRAAAA